MSLGRFLCVALASAALALSCLGLPAASSTDGGAPGPAVASGAGCKPCATASACCDAVGGGPECVFSAATCASLTGNARDTYIDGCQTFVKSVAVAWKQKPPSECF